MYQNLKKKTEGFTIIEVLIVLAIAGLIMLIVFLAVPALQRNSRNNGRNNDASRISAAITECMANHNNVVTSCDAPGDIQRGDMSQLTGLSWSGAYITALHGTVDTAYYAIGNFQCNPDGSAAVAGGGSRSHAVVYQLEGSSGTVNRCISS